MRRLNIPKVFSLLGLFMWFWSATCLYAQPHVKERTMRGVWICTVNNLDFPSANNLSSKEQQAEFISILDSLKALNFNTVFVQVRPAADAFYYSAFEAWSEWLNGKQGQMPTPYYDPLAFMVTEAHKRGIEFHAWFNPFRVSLRKTELADNHILQREKEWALQYGAARMLNPGLPAVREFVSDVVLDVVNRYDIDGVHLDDYFYPYPEKDIVLKDSATFEVFKNSLKAYQAKNKADSLAEWRRYNIDDLIWQLYVRIKKVKPYIRFGISPFAVWRSSQKDPLGTATKTGATCYDDLHADVRGWLQKGWLDYVAPQIYFSHQLAQAPFELLFDWWKRNSFERNFYIGHAVYKMGDLGAANKDSAWLRPNEMAMQFEKANNKAQGSIFYRWTHLKKNPLHLKDSLRKWYNKPALSPAMPWLKAELPPSASFVMIEGCKSGFLIEVPALPFSDMNWQYHLYRYDGLLSDAPEWSEKNHLVSFSAQTRFYLDRNVLPKGEYTYVLVVGDRLGQFGGYALQNLVYKKKFTK